MISPTTATSPRLVGRLSDKCDPDPVSRMALERFAETRDLRLRDELVRRYDRVVQWVAKREAREPGHMDDLMQVGRMALVQALERFEPTRGVRFTIRESLRKLRGYLGGEGAAPTSNVN